MNNYAKSWVFWLILIVVVIILLAAFVGTGNSSHYEFSGIKNIIRSQLEDFENPNIDDIDADIEYRISGVGDQHEEDITVCDDNHIELEPQLPPTFLPDVSVGDPSGIKRTKPEEICKKTLEKIYKKKFSCVHPEWLRNPETNRKLELDCYNDELKIACEYNGIQHYKWPNQYPMTREQFLAQNRRDNFKIDACDANGVYLITVPYNVPYDLIPDYINYFLPHNVKRRQEFGIEE